jgi:RNA polymerase sigma-70 factor (ECF subfamily)
LAHAHRNQLGADEFFERNEARPRLPIEIADRQPDPEKRYAQSEERTMLRKAIQSLRPTLQQLQERSTQETAEAIGISLAAAKARLFHGKIALRRSLVPKLEYQLRVASGSVLYPRLATTKA